MSLATQFFSAVLTENNRQALYLINPVWFNDDELATYEMIVEHIRLYGALPSAHTVRQRGFELPRAEEPVDYYITRLPERAIHTFYRERFPDLVDMLERRDVGGITTALQEMLEYATVTGNTNMVRTMEQELRDITSDFSEARTQVGLQGITTGYAPLDMVTGGLQPGDMYAIVGRPGMGKSYTLFNMANAAWQAGASVLIVSMEMSVRQCSRRIVGMNSGLSPDAIRRGQVSRYAESQFFGTMAELEGRPPMHFLAGEFEKSVGDVDVLVQELRPDALYFDSAYLASPSNSTKRRASRREYVADAFGEIKGIAIRRDIPAVVSSQLNREAKKKATLDLSMIGETDAIGQMVTTAVAVAPGAGAFNRTRRTQTLLKNREGDDDLKFDTHFKFAPMNFAAIPGSERTKENKPWLQRDGMVDDAMDRMQVTDQAHDPDVIGYDD